MSERVNSEPVSTEPAELERRLAGLRRPWRAGESGNPGGRPRGERALLQRMCGRDGRKVFARLEELRNDPKTPKRLQMQIDFFVIERLFGRAPQMVGVERGPSLLSLLSEVHARATGGES